MTHWTPSALQHCLEDAFGRERVESVPTLDGAVQVQMPEAGDMVITLVATEHQVMASTPLVLAARVADRAGFNEACLRLNPINPLSNLGLATIGGEDVYIVFGELSPDATAAQVVHEVDTLADNALEAIQILSPYLA